MPGYDRGTATLSYIKAFQDAGATPLQIVQSMTLHAAKTIGVETERGFIKPGLAADIIAMPGNPLEQIDQLKNVFFVMKDGRIVRHDK